jgi:hypothetical protein
MHHVYPSRPVGSKNSPIDRNDKLVGMVVSTRTHGRCNNLIMKGIQFGANPAKRRQTATGPSNRPIEILVQMRLAWGNLIFEEI